MVKPNQHQMASFSLNFRYVVNSTRARSNSIQPVNPSFGLTVTPTRLHRDAHRRLMLRQILHTPFQFRDVAHIYPLG